MKTPWTKRKQRLRILRKIEERKKEARENSDAILNENMHKKRKQLSYAPIINGTFLNPQEETKLKKYLRQEAILSERRDKIEERGLLEQIKKAYSNTRRFINNFSRPLIAGGLALTLGGTFMAVRYFSPLDKVQQKQWEQSLLREYEDKDNLLALKILLEKEMTPELRNSLKTNKPVLLNEELPKDKDGPYIPKGRTAILQVLARDPNLGTTDGTKSNAGIYVTLKGYKTSKQIYANTNRGAGSNQLFADGVRIKIDSPGNYTLNGEITNGDGTNDNTSLEIRVK